MKNLFLLFFLCLSVCLSAQSDSKAIFSASDIDIPHKKFVLDNGLTLLVHEDHKAPIVAVNVWYHVGSKNEKPGKSGFAHLFEHLMFNGSENYNDDYFQAIERIGGTDVNGTTNSDRTNYFQNVPVAALDQVLFLESDRMGHLLGAIDQEKLDEQRGVVQNEKRQGENQPYGRQYEIMTKEMHPKGHPYSWTVIGEMEDLNAASLEDVHEWFKTYYGAANAVLSIAGDVDAEDIHQRVKKYFGHIPAGPTLIRPGVNIPKLDSKKRISLQDRVPESRIVMSWNSPQWGSKEDALLNLASDVLSGGKTSRLYKALVYDEQLASRVSAYQYGQEIAGGFVVQVNVKPGVDVAQVEQKMEAILADFLKNGPSQAELDRVKNRYFANYIKGLERIGGFGGKSDALAINQVYGGNPDYYKTYNKYIEEASPSAIRNATQKWLVDEKLVLTINPFPEYSNTDEDVDRSQVPVVGEAAKVKFPDLQKATLSNGLKVVLAQRKDVPSVVMNMIFDAGYAADQFGKPGIASLAMNMIDEGTAKMDALQISDEMQSLGASVYAYSDLDASYYGMNTLKPSFDASLDLYADILLNPAFPEKEFKRLKQEQISNIQREKATPVQMALRVMPKFLYGDGHAYSLPLTGSGFEETVESMTRDDVQQFYQSWIRPNNATLVVVGDLSMDELKTKLEKKLAGWKKGDIKKKNVATVESKKGNTLYLMDRPESLQSIIIAGHLAAPYGKVSETAREAMMNVLGGEFTSRLNMNLREDKHWAYGAFAFMQQAVGQRPLLAYAPVQTDKTSESIAEIIREFKAIATDKPVTQEEFAKTTNNAILKLPGRWETNRSVANSVGEIVKYELPDNYYQKYDESVRKMNLQEVMKVTKELVHPEQMNWFVVGDKEKVLPGLKQMDFEKIVLVDANGKELETIKTGPARP